MVRTLSEVDLQGFQVKKATRILSSQPKLRSGTPIAWVKQGGVEFGKITGTKASPTETLYVIQLEDKSVVNVRATELLTQEMYMAIYYRPVIIMMHLEREDQDGNIDIEPTACVTYTWDSWYLPCPVLKKRFEALLTPRALKFLESTKDFTQCRKCTVCIDGDCRRRIVRHLGKEVLNSWEAARNAVADLTLRMTLYADGSTNIDTSVKRKPFIKWIPIQEWLSKHKTSAHLEGLLDAVREYEGWGSLAIPKHQVEAIKTLSGEIYSEQNTTPELQKLIDEKLSAIKTDLSKKKVEEESEEADLIEAETVE